MTKLSEAREKFVQILRLRRFSAVYIEHLGLTLRMFDQALRRGGKDDPPVDTLTADDVFGFVRHLNEYRNIMTGRPLGETQILERLRTLRRFLNYLHENDLMARNIGDAIKTGRRVQTAPRGILTRHEVARLLAVPNTKTYLGLRDRVMLEVLYGCGLRAAELLALDRGDIDLEKRFLTVRSGKGAKDRVVPLSDVAAEWLARYIAEAWPRFLAHDRETAALFMSSAGLRISVGLLHKNMQEYRRRAGIKKPGACHALRHSIATHLLEEGLDLRYIQEFLGHSRISSTEIYTTVALGGLRERMERHHPRVKMKTISDNGDAE